MDVTQATTKRGDIVYHILLNGNILIKYVYPDDKWRSSGKRNRSCSSRLNEFWKKNDNSLMNLIGKYIVASLIDTEFGKQFSAVISTDIVIDFKKLLDNANGLAFKADIPIYSFLRNMNYPVNYDNSISLRKDYSGYNINSDNLCYPNSLSGIMDNFKKYYEQSKGRAFQINFPIFYLLLEMGFKKNTDNSITLKDEYSLYNVNCDNICYPNNTTQEMLNFENIDKIFEHFYRNKIIYSNHDSQGDTTYSCSSYAIYESHAIYKVGHMKDKLTGSFKSIVLAIGDDLKEEHLRFLSKNDK